MRTCTSCNNTIAESAVMDADGLHQPRSTIFPKSPFGNKQSCYGCTEIYQQLAMYAFIWNGLRKQLRRKYSWGACPQTPLPSKRLKFCAAQNIHQPCPDHSATASDGLVVQTVTWKHTASYSTVMHTTAWSSIAIKTVKLKYTTCICGMNVIHQVQLTSKSAVTYTYAYHRVVKAAFCKTSATAVIPSTPITLFLSLEEWTWMLNNRYIPG